MTYNTSYLQNATAQEVFVGTIVVIPFLIPLISIFEFFIILGAGAMLNKIRTGYTNILAWASVSALTTTTSVAFLGGIFRNNQEYISYLLPTLIVWIILSVVCTLALFLNRDE